jgi:16S rRNA (guanine527-N7)-methyltransferase
VSHARPSLALATSTPLTPLKAFTARLEAEGINVGDATLAQLGAYLGHLLAMNEQMNLTAITNAEDAWERHIFDALTLLAPLAEFPAGARLVDVGSGGGIPGIVLAIARPDLQITLVEATQKKAWFLSAVSTAVGATNVSVYAERAEVLVRKELVGSFDVVTARAVARLLTLAPLTVPFVRPGGLALLIKGQRADEELAEASRTIRTLRASHERTIPTPTGRIVLLRRAPT